MPVVPVVRCLENGQQREERTTTPGALVARLGEPEGLEVIRPSLEDIYLTLVGEYDAGGVSTSSTTEGSVTGVSPSSTTVTTEGAAL